MIPPMNLSNKTSRNPHVVTTNLWTLETSLQRCIRKQRPKQARPETLSKTGLGVFFSKIKYLEIQMLKPNVNGSPKIMQFGRGGL